MERGPSAGRWTSHANSSPFPEHQRSLCYLGFWTRQETTDPSLKAGELKQSVPRWKDLNSTHILPAHRSFWGDRAVCVSAEGCLGRASSAHCSPDSLHLVRTWPLYSPRWLFCLEVTFLHQHHSLVTERCRRLTARTGLPGVRLAFQAADLWAGSPGRSRHWKTFLSFDFFPPCHRKLSYKR